MFRNNVLLVSVIRCQSGLENDGVKKRTSPTEGIAHRSTQRKAAIEKSHEKPEHRETVWEHTKATV